MIALRCIAAILVSGWTLSVAAADPLSDLLAAKGGGACYERVYDAAHLAANPGQRTHSLRMRLAPFADGTGAIARIEIRAPRETRFILAECGWSERPNDDALGQPLILTYKAGPGLVCHARAAADEMSAEEGGDFVIDDKDGQSMTIHLPPELVLWQGDRPAPKGAVPLGRDDRVFLVHAAPAGRCADLDALLPWEGADRLSPPPSLPGAVDMGTR